MSSIGKVNLKKLYDSGELTVTPTILDAGSDPPSVLFDGYTNEGELSFGTEYYSLNDDVNNLAGFTFTFDPPLQGNKYLIKSWAANSVSASLYVNNNPNYSITTKTPRDSNRTLKANIPLNANSSISTLEFRHETNPGTIAGDLRVSEIEIYVTEDNNPYEFNDSVLSTKAWNSSRYDGRQLSATTLNKISESDIGNNNKTPILRNYTRNIYIGNEIVGMAETNPEDPSLVQFPNFSYAQINSYITVNEDGTITKNNLDPQENNTDNKNAFYRPFLYDFEEGSFCNFILGDTTVKNNLKSKYPIFFNGGQFRKLLTLSSHWKAPFSTPPSRFTGELFIYEQRRRHADDDNDGVNLFGGQFTTASAPILEGVPEQSALYFGGQVGSNTSLGNTTVLSFTDIEDSNSFTKITTGSFHTASLHNPDIYTNWYTGSLYKQTFFYSSQANAWKSAKVKLDLEELLLFISNQQNYKANSNYKGDKRLFLTLAGYHSPDYFPVSIGDPSAPPPLLQGNPKPLYQYEQNNVNKNFPAKPITDVRIENLSTFEIEDLNALGKVDFQTTHYYEFVFSQRTKTTLNGSTRQNTYGAGASSDIEQTIGTTYSSSSLKLGDHILNWASGSAIISVTDDDIPSILIPLKKDRELPSGKGDKPFAIIPENLHPYIKDNLIFYLSKAGIDIGGNATDKVEESISKKPKPPTLPAIQRTRIARKNVEVRIKREKDAKEELDLSKRERRRARRSERREDRQERRDQRRENRNERRENRQERREERRENRQENRNDRRENRQNRRENRRNRRRNR